MSIFIKTPFKCNRIENDPTAYGLRDDIIRSCILELANDQSIVISGPRGIGKSSLCAQLQGVLEGDDTLMKRCMLTINLPNYITAFHPCHPDDTLLDLIESIIDQIETKLDSPKQKVNLKAVKVEFSLKVFKTTLDLEKNKESHVKTLAYLFVEAIMKINESYINPHINIAIDEIDQLDEKINIAHFLKVIQELLTRKGIDSVSFILAGQSGVNSRLINQQPAFDRMAKHYKLSILDIDNSKYVLESCLKRAEIKIHISDPTAQLILGLACGYPYMIHLLGHETFLAMCDRYPTIPSINYLQIITDDITLGVKSILDNKEDRFNDIIRSLNDEEKRLVFNLSLDSQRTVPFRFSGEVLKNNGDNASLDIAHQLCVKHILAKKVLKTDQSIVYVFCEELFRVYLTYTLQKNEDEIQKNKWQPNFIYEDIALNVNDCFF